MLLVSGRRTRVDKLVQEFIYDHEVKYDPFYMAAYDSFLSAYLNYYD